MISTATEATKLVLTEGHDGVLTMTINRPAQKNAINHEVAVQLASALDLFDADPEPSVGVLTGAGGTFSAGMDLKGFAHGDLPTIPGRGFGGLMQGDPAHDGGRGRPGGLRASGRDHRASVVVRRRARGRAGVRREA